MSIHFHMTVTKNNLDKANQIFGYYGYPKFEFEMGRMGIHNQSIDKVVNIPLLITDWLLHRNKASKCSYTNDKRVETLLTGSDRIKELKLISIYDTDYVRVEFVQ